MNEIGDIAAANGTHEATQLRRKRHIFPKTEGNNKSTPKKDDIDTAKSVFIFTYNLQPSENIEHGMVIHTK